MKVGIIGYGNMGSAFAKGLVRKVGAENLIVYDVSEEKRKKALEDGIATAGNLYFLVQNSDILFVAVKPKDVKGVLEEIKDQLGEKVLVTMAAGLKISFYEEVLGRNKKIVRIMPNVNVAVGEGAIACTPNDAVSEEELDHVADLLSSCGEVFFLKEDLFDAFTALAGSGPAFVFAFADALAMAGVKEGIPYDQALAIALKTLSGSAKLLLELGGNPNEWITKVTSPGGTTVEGISYLEKKGFRGIVMKCIEKTAEKSRRLSG